MSNASERGVFQEQGLQKELSQGTAKLIVVRHAQSQANVEGYHISNPSLTEKGRKQAQDLGKFFRDESIVFDAVYTSPKPRTQQTATEVLTAMDLSLPINTREGLREKSLGISREIPENVAQSARKELDITVPRLTDEERWEYIPNIDGIDKELFETERSVANRMNQALTEIAGSHPGETVLVVSHFMAMRAHLASMEEEPSDNSAFTENWVGNTGFYVVTHNAAGTSEFSLEEKRLRRI